MKITAQVAPKELQEAVSNPAYEIIAPGTYTAVMNRIDVGFYRAGYTIDGAKVPNPASGDGKYEYIKFTPAFTLQNENSTVIDRQGFVGGLWDSDTGAIVSHPDKPEDNPIWKGSIGAFHLLNALNLIDAEGALSFDSDLLGGAVVRVAVATSGYRKAAREDYRPHTLEAMLKSVNDGQAYTVEQLPGLVQKWNKENNSESDGLKLKNTVVAIYAVNDDSLYFVNEDTGVCYISEEALDASYPQEDEF